MASVRATRVRRLRIRKAVERTTLAVVVMAAGMLYLAVEKRVTLVVEGRPEAIRTFSSSVGQLLSAEGIALAAVEVVHPPLATALADGMTVVVDLAEGPDHRNYAWQNVGEVEAWAVVGAKGSWAMLAALTAEIPVSANRFVEPSQVVSARVVVKGKEHDVVTTATTVGELLSAMGIELDDRDRIEPPPSALLHSGDLVRYVDVEVRVRRVKSAIPFTRVTTYTNDLPPGEARIVRSGEPGVMLQAVRVRRVDGEVVGRKVLWRRVLVPAVPERRLVGKRENLSHGTQVGEASWYYAPGTGLTAAHPSLAFGTVVTVTNLENGRTVTVVINDRGPFGGRIIDLSEEAFAAIAPLGQGVAQVRLTW